MSLDKLRKVVESVRPQILFDPGYYSGRGATLTDLDSSRLWYIQQGIKEVFGEKASDAFVDMVSEIEVMSCTTFLKELNNLYFRDWVVIKKEKDESNVYVTNEGNAFATAVLGMTSSSGHDRDDTQEIKAMFMRKNKRQPRKVLTMVGDKNGNEIVRFAGFYKEVY